MSQVKVPESIMYGIIGPDGKPYFDEFCVSGRCGDLAAEVLGLNEHSGEGLYREAGLITTDQAEAYAEARVRGALELAIAFCDAAYEQGKSEYKDSGYNPYFEGGCDAAESIESKIRALIP